MFTLEASFQQRHSHISTNWLHQRAGYEAAQPSNLCFLQHHFHPCQAHSKGNLLAPKHQHSSFTCSTCTVQSTMRSPSSKELTTSLLSQTTHQGQRKFSTLCSSCWPTARGAILSSDTHFSACLAPRKGTH